MNIFIQKHGKGFKFDGCYAALEGAYHSGDEVILFDDIMEVPANKRVMVVACVEDTAIWLQRVGIEEPKSLAIFPGFEPYITRKLEVMPMGMFIDFVKLPAFVKPFEKVKAFEAGVLEKESSKKMFFGKLDSNMKVLVSSLIDIKSEYRIYVDKDKGIIGMQHYHGDSMVYPNNDYIADVVSYTMTLPHFPDAYTVDIAVHNQDGKLVTEIIEYQDAWSIGSYGLPSHTYLNFLKKRWLQLMRYNK